MQQFGGKDSKRHFTVVMGGKEHGLYVSSTPSSAAKKAVTKLCAANKSKKVEFSIREITQGSKKKTYGAYTGHIEKLKEPIELKGRVIKYKPVAKLSGKSSSKKGGMKGGFYWLIFSIKYTVNTTSNFRNDELNKLIGEQAKKLDEFCKNEDTRGIFNFSIDSDQSGDHKFSEQIEISFRNYKEAKQRFKYDKTEYDKIIKKLIVLIKNIKKSFEEFSLPHRLPSGYDKFEVVIPDPNNNPNNSNSPNRLNISKFSYIQFLKYLHKELEEE